MCYNPSYILNPSRSFDMHRDKLGYNVPCGHCGQCRSAKQVEYEVRNYYEYVDTIKKGGIVFFDTLTYDEVNVPINLGFKTFDSRDYTHFMDNLRHNLYKLGFDPAVDSLKVFFSSEYGGITKRPHYHLLLFVVAPCLGSNPHDMALKLNDLVVISWQKGRNDRRWCEPHYDNNHNWVSASGIESKLVNAQGAIAYVSKYVTKDFDYQDALEGQKGSTPVFLDDDVNDLPRYKKARTADEKLKDYFKSIEPFHRQSNGLGLSILDYCSEEDIINGSIPIPDNNSQVLAVMPLSDTPIPVSYVKLPNYIDRKKFYNYNKETKCFRLKEVEGKDMKRKRFENNSRYVESVLRELFFNVDSFITFEYRLKMLHYGITLPDIKQFIDDFFSKNTPYELAIYNIVYKDRFTFDGCSPDLAKENFIDGSVECDFYTFNLITDFTPESEYSLQNYYESSKDRKIFKVVNGEGVMITPDSNDIIKRFKRYTYNVLPCFTDFDKMLSLYNDIMHFYCDSQQRNYIDNSRLKSQYHSIFNMY